MKDVSFISESEGLKAELQRDGFAAYAEQLTEYAKIAVEYSLIGILKTDLTPLGASKLGGLPDASQDFEWPTHPAYPTEHSIVQMHRDWAQEHRGLKTPTWPHKTLEDHRERAYEEERAVKSMLSPAPLQFIGQFDLGEVRANVGDLELFPESGHLLFFYDAEHQPWGSNPFEQTCFKVIFVEASDTKLERAEPPEGLPVFPVAKLVESWKFCPLPPDTIIAENLMAKADHLITFRAWWSDVWSKNKSSARHQLGGWPNTIQGDMQLPAEIVSRGYSTSENEIYNLARENGFEKPAEEWVLLLQISTEDELGMSWGDDGCLYVWIKKSDLAVRDFSKCYLELQCF